MYDTFIMLKPDASCAVEELHALVSDVMKSGAGTVERKGNHVRVTSGTGSLEIAWHDSAYVADESDEIAERFGVPSEGCRAQFEMAGDDPDMELFNDYLLTNERLQATGKFVIFDRHDRKLLFE